VCQRLLQQLGRLKTVAQARLKSLQIK